MTFIRNLKNTLHVTADQIFVSSFIDLNHFVKFNLPRNFFNGLCLTYLSGSTSSSSKTNKKLLTV